MADSPFTSTEQQNAQRTYLHETAVNYQNEADVWGMAQDWTESPINDIGLKVPLELSPNPSLKVVNLDGGSVPQSQARDLDNMTIGYGQLMASGATTYEALLNNNKETAGDQEARRIESDVKQFVKFLNDYASRGDGTTALATASANYDSSTATTKRTFTCNGSTDSIGPSQVVVGGWYQIFDATGATVRVSNDTESTGFAVTSSYQVASKTASTIVFASGTVLPDDYVSTDILVPVTGTTDAATGFIAGLPYIIDSAGTYFGKSRSSVTQLQAYENVLSGSLTAAELVETYMGISQRGGYGFGANAELVDQLVMGMGITQKQNYYNLSLSSGAVVGGIHQFNHNPDGKPKYDIGMKNMEFSWFGAPIKTFNSVQGSDIYFLNTKYLKKAVLKNVGEASHGFGDSVQLINSSGVRTLAKAEYRDFVGQFFSPTPHRLGKISAITITGLVTQKAAMV
jgi:hypothetical protein